MAWGYEQWGQVQWGGYGGVAGFAASQTGDYEITLDFGIDIELDGVPGEAALDPASYTVTPTATGYPVTVEAVTIDPAEPDKVMLTISVVTDGQGYEVEVVGAVEAEGGASQQGETSSFVASISDVDYTIMPVGLRSLRIVFDREMRNNDDLLDPAKYVFTGGITAETVTRLGPSEVVVGTTQQVTDTLYQLTVGP